MSTLWDWFKGLVVAIGSAITFSGNCAIAQMTPDATLPNNSQVTIENNIRIIQVDPSRQQFVP
jgi:hypothetical protein